VKTFYINGKAPVAGTIFRNPDLAKAFRLIQQQGRDAMYRGEIGRAMVAKSKALGGPMTLEDLANYKGEWVTPHQRPITTTSPCSAREHRRRHGDRRGTQRPRGVRSHWYPGKTLATLGPANPLYWHALVETKKAVYRDVYGYNADPNAVNVPLDMLTSKAHATSLCGKVNPARAAATGPANADANGTGDTIYLAAADRMGKHGVVDQQQFLHVGIGNHRPGYGSFCTIAAACSRWIPRVRTSLRATSVPTTRCRRCSSCATARRCWSRDSTVAISRAGQHAGARQHPRSRCEHAGRGRHGEVQSQPGRNELQMESQLFQLVGSRLKEMGHKVSSD
jgi:gamma-glutamyltranspeptidase/glutathione hydrolase